MSRRKKSHQSHGSPNRPRLWGKHAVAAALDNPKRKVLRAWATREASAFMQLPKDVAVTIAEAPDLGRLVPHDAPHQGVVIEVEPLEEAWLDELITEPPEGAVLLVLDQVTDPHNVGAILRSVAAFGGHGVVIPQRRSASVTAVAWRTSAGAAARLPVARATNLNRTLQNWAGRGLQVIGLDAGGDTTIDQLDATGPVVVVVGSEGKGLSRLVRENCDAVVSIPMAGPTESLHASVAAGVVLAEIARQRRG